MYRFFVLLICIPCWFASAQTSNSRFSYKNIPLKELITEIENLYKVKFSYIDQTVEDKFVSISYPEAPELSTLLSEITKLTGLHFSKINKNNFSIRSIQDTVATLCGYLFDENRKPIENARIFLKNSKVNLLTNDQGFFEFKETVHNPIVLISIPGFRQRVLYQNDFLSKECISIVLEPEAERLDEVLILEYITKGIIKQRNQIDINIDDVQILPGLSETDILQSIQLTPGVNSPFETASGLYIRGNIPNQNLILWNGIRTYNQGHFFGMLSAFNPYAAHEVKFIKNAPPSQYGDRIGSIIEISTVKEIPDQFTGSLGLNMIYGDVVASIPLVQDRLSAQISMRRSYNDFINTPTYDQYAKRVFQNTAINSSLLKEDQDNFYFTDYTTNLTYQISPKNQLDFNSFYSKNDLDFVRSNETQSFQDVLYTENEGYHLKWKTDLSQKTSIKSSLYFSKYAMDYQFVTSEDTNIQETESKNNYIEESGGQIHVEIGKKDRKKMEFGYQFTNHLIAYAFVTETSSYELIPDFDRSQLLTHSVYGQFTYASQKNWFYDIGIRNVFYQDLKQFYIEPRFLIEKKLSNQLSLLGSAEYRTQSVTQIRESVVSDLSLENELWRLPDQDDFPIIDSYQFTLGGSYKKKKWVFDVEGYYKSIDGLTSLTAGFINPVDNAYHKGKSRIYGADVFLKKRFQKFKSWLSYSYTNTANTFENVNNDRRFPGNWNIEHTLRWSNFYSIGSLDLSLGWLWHTGKAYTNIIGISDDGSLITLEYDKINGSNLPIYHRLDFTASYDFSKKSKKRIKYKAGLSILNLYNQKNLLNREFRVTNSLDNRLIRKNIEALGITPNLSLRMYW